MSKFNGRDVCIEVPDDWQDRTIIAFSSPLQPKQTVAPNIVLTRDSIGANEPASAYADKQLVELAKRLEAFNLSSRQDITLGGLAAVELVFTWRGGNGILKQKQIFVAPGNGLVITFVATALVSDFSSMEPVFGAILDTVEFPSARGSVKLQVH